MDIIKKSFKACGISVALDGSENCEINVFKNPDCVIGLELEKWQDENDQVVEEDVEEEEKMMVDSDEDSEDEVLLDDE